MKRIYDYPNNTFNAFSKTVSLLFIVSIVLMIGGYLFETISFENESIFDKPLKVKGVDGWEDQFQYSNPDVETHVSVFK